MINMAAPMFALQPIPNPTFDIDFGKCLPHKSYTAAELQAWLNKITNPFDASWIVSLTANASLSVDGKGIKFIPTVTNDDFQLFLNFKNRVNWVAYAKRIVFLPAKIYTHMSSSNYWDMNSLSFKIEDTALLLTQKVGGANLTLYNRIIPSATTTPIYFEEYIECYAKMIKFWLASNIEKVNTNGWQSASTTLASPTNKGIQIRSLYGGTPFVASYSYIQKLQVKFTDGVFT